MAEEPNWELIELVMKNAEQSKGLTAGDVSGLLEVRADNRKAFKSAFNQALARALEEIGLTAEGYAKKACPVHTGRLGNSITHVIRPSEKAVYIGTNVEYAIFVECDHKSLSGKTIEGKRFLRGAASGHKGTYRAILKKNLGGS